MLVGQGIKLAGSLTEGVRKGETLPTVGTTDSTFIEDKESVIELPLTVGNVD